MSDYEISEWIIILSTYLKVCYSPQQPLTTESEGKQLLLGSRCACTLQRNILLCIKELIDDC